MATVVVRKATSSDETPCASIFTTALADYPVSRWSIANRRTASRADAQLCAGILTAALVDDPVARWLIADRHDRWRIHCRHFHRFVCHGVDTGTVQIADEGGCAVGFPSTAPDAVGLEAELVVLCEQYAQRFSLFGQIVHERHPEAPAHDYLMLLGVTPDQQRRGLGSALLEHHLAGLDAAGMPSYLEATTRRSAKGVYTPAGYRQLGKPIQFPQGLQVTHCGVIPDQPRGSCDASGNHRRWGHWGDGHCVELARRRYHRCARL